MENYKKNKELLQYDNLGCLFFNNEDVNSCERPIIYVGNHFGNNLSFINNIGFTNDKGCNVFSGNFNYQLNNKSMNAINLADSLSKTIDMLSFDEVDLVGRGYGGLIASYASLNPKVNRVYAVHAPIIGSPLACPKDMEKAKEYYNKKELYYLKLLKKLINSDLAYMQDWYLGLNLKYASLNKIVVISGTLNPFQEENKLLVDLYHMIFKYCRIKSDGISVFSERIFQEYGLVYLKEKDNISYLSSNNKDYLEDLKRSIKILVR